MRSLLLVLDSVGIGRAPDAADNGDAGADTLADFFGLAEPLPVGKSFLSK